MGDFIKCRNSLGEIVELPKEKFHFRPSAYGVIKKGNKILTVTTKDNGKIWLPGGAVKIEENLKEGLIRECNEETGLKLKRVGELLLFKENLVYLQSFDEAIHAYLFFYLCDVEAGEATMENLDEDEDVCEVKWVDINDIKKEDINDLQEDIYQMLNKLK